jgi:hypothetical protein
VPRNPGAAKALLRCRCCRYEVKICVPVRRGVPEFLRCDHDEHGGVSKNATGDILCERCHRAWRLEGDQLPIAVEEALGNNMREWQRRGLVVLDCG